MPQMVSINSGQGRHSPVHGVPCSHLAASQTWLPPWRTGRVSPGRAHKERPRCRIATGIKKFAAFPGGALSDFWFPKRGVGWVRAPADMATSKKSSSRPKKLSFKWGVVVALVRDSGLQGWLR